MYLGDTPSPPPEGNPSGLPLPLSLRGMQCRSKLEGWCSVRHIMRRLPRPVPVIARLDRAIQELAQHSTWIIRSSRMMTPNLYPWVVIPSFTSPPVPLSLRRGGISIAGGHPQSPTRGISLWTPFATVVVRSASDEAIPGMMGGKACKAEIASLRSQ